MYKQPLGAQRIYHHCLFDGDSVNCRDVKQESHLKIPIRDIICVLPNHGHIAYQYTILFLRSDIGPSDEIESIHLETAPSAFLSIYLLTKIPHHLCHSSNPDLKLHVIISSKSGTGTAKVLFSRLQQLFAQVGVNNIEVHETQSARTITNLCRSSFVPHSIAGAPQTIIVISGDGGVSDLIDAFHGNSRDIRLLPNIALIPAGTGNALASSMGLATHPAAALIALLRGRPVPLPAFVATFSPGARYIQNHQTQPLATDETHTLKLYGGIVASWGLHAALVADSDTPEYRGFGADRFRMAANELLYPADGSETHKYNGTVTLINAGSQHNFEDEKALQHEEHTYVLGTLVSNLEKDFMISPKSSPLDGSLRFLRFGPVSPQLTMRLLSAAYQGGLHVEDIEVFYSEVEGFKIDFHELDEKWRRVCIDGKVVIVEAEGWMKVQKEQRRLINILWSNG